MSNETVILSRSENQALGLGKYAVDFMAGKLGDPAESVFQKVEQFHLDSIACGVSALARRANAPTVLRAEALQYLATDGQGVPLFASRPRSCPRRRWWPTARPCASGTPTARTLAITRRAARPSGEFGHNDFYPVAVAAAQLRGLDGRQTLRAMILLDEIRGRLAEVFALKNYKIDHVVHGAIGSAATFGAVLGATPEEIESAIGLVVAHYIPFRAIRAGKQLSDSKGASAAISAEVAVLSMRRAMRGSSARPTSFATPRRSSACSKSRRKRTPAPSTWRWGPAETTLP